MVDRRALGSRRMSHMAMHELGHLLMSPEAAHTSEATRKPTRCAPPHSPIAARGTSREHRARPSRRSRAAASATGSSSDDPSSSDPPPALAGHTQGLERCRAVVAA